jgi:uncharacterized protein
MTPVDEHNAWQARRRRAVSAPTGNLALVETRWALTIPRPRWPGSHRQ